MSTSLKNGLKHAPRQELPGGLKSLRAPVVVSKPKKKRKRPASADPHQVEKAPKPRIKRGPHWNDNDRVYLTGLDLNTTMPAADFAAFIGSLVETKDPLDRAHKQRRLIDPEHPDRYPKHLDESYVLLSHQELELRIKRASKKPKVTVRRYHPSQLTSRDVAFDSMYDRAFAIAEKMHGQGVNLGWGVRKTGDYSPAEQDRAKVLAGMSRDQARSALLAPRINDEMDDHEKKLHAQASRFLKERLSKRQLNRSGIELDDSC